MKDKINHSIRVSLLGFAAVLPALTSGQDAATDEEIIELSPFEVSTTEDTGYRATDTLAGTRIRTDLNDVASSISVVTSQFMQDTGVTNNQDLLIYTTNTEVGGIYGNYAAVGNTLTNGANESASLLRPSQNTRVRGLDSADNTRDFFVSDIPWDGYIVDRVDLQRGPNSILFGLGSPAGIINTSLNSANVYDTFGEFEARFGSFGTKRFTFDANNAVIDDVLAVRVSLLDDRTKYRQTPAYNHDKRLFAALRWEPKWTEHGTTSIRANFETGSVKANRPRSLPPWDRISPWFDPANSVIHKRVWDPYEAWQNKWIALAGSDSVPEGVTQTGWLTQYPGPGIQGTNNPMFLYDNTQATTPSITRQAGPNTYWGINGSGGRDGGIDGFPFGSMIGIAGYNEQSKYNSGFPAAEYGIYKDKSLTDSSIFDFYNILIDGPNKKEWQDWKAFNMALSQTWLSNRVGVEFVYDYQDYEDGQTRNLNNPYIAVDILGYTMDYPSVYAAATTNPNAGRAFVGSNAKNYGNNVNLTERENLRATAFAEFRAEDLLEKSTLTDILGRHVITGIASEETYSVETRNWVRYAIDPSYADAIGSGLSGTGIGSLQNGDLALDWVTYLTGDLRGVDSPSGLHIPGITAVQSPSGTAAIKYYDSHWNAPGVDPSAYWFNAARNEDDKTQSENPANYIGWVTDSFKIYNADKGDRNLLYTDVSLLEQKTQSQGLTWQGFLFNDNVVTTVGWRHDELEQRSGANLASQNRSEWTSALGGAELNPTFAVDDNGRTIVGTSEGDSVSWGIVLHTPEFINQYLPWGTELSLAYSHGKNMRVERRYGFNAQALPNAEGETDDISMIINTLNEKLQVKMTYYETRVYNANISSVSSEVATLGDNTYYLRNLEAWGTASALMNRAGMAGDPNFLGWEWYWNWALVDNGWDGVYNDPNGAEFLNAQSTANEIAATNAWLEQMLPQEWFDAYGFPVDVAAAQAGDWTNAIASWSPSSGVGGVQPAGGGKVNGVWPTGLVDNLSRGVEIEILAQPLPNWNISLNIAKTSAKMTALGEDLSSFIEESYAKYQSPAGDLRLWWGGDKTVREYFNENIWAAYQFQLLTIGRKVGQLAPWRANLVTNYSINEGFLKGTNLGVAYRWQQATVLGYYLNDEGTILDLDKPIMDVDRSHLDLWVGYSRPINDTIDWRIQLNLRNVGEDVELVPFSVQPDGSPAGFRIEEGMTWTLTNTISF